ncbi:MAG: dTDP-4-amino-4,6-dideoxygalactose transaminase [Candidatus Hydrogenedens sp.]|nr:dTDP-4-amino-4,6-dideoxygalactose transaminase [Candidatus Hydrogenedens sp.]
MIDIPLNRVVPLGREMDYVRQAVESGFVMGGGPFTERCEKLLQDCLDVPRALLTTSCTDALEMMALLLNLEPGDEVIVPSFTFPSTANAFALRGCVPVFADILPDTLNLDAADVEACITPRTRLIVAMHYAGIPCDMDALHAISTRHGIPMVEDNAHGLFGRHDGRPLGSFGSLASLSFHETKNFSCGEGGALLINDPALIERAEIIREKGTNRLQFMRGEVRKYTWVDFGSSYLPSEMLAAFLFGQLEAHALIQERRRHVWNRYRTELGDWARSHEVQLPFVPESAVPAFHLFHLLFPSPDARLAVETHLRSQGIYAVTHYQPLHLSDMGRRFTGEGRSLPVTESSFNRLLRLPFYTSLDDSAQDRVIAAVRAFSV